MTQDSSSAELWRKVPKWPYEASNLGRIRRLSDDNFEAAGSIVAPWTKGQKYPMVMLYRPAETLGVRDRWQVAAHRVIAETWLGPMPAPGWEVDHKDGVRANNRLENLEWVTAKRNIGRAVERGHHGPRRYNAKLTEQQVGDIWMLSRAGLSRLDIADRLDLRRHMVDAVLSGKNYRHVSAKFNQVEETRC